MGTLVLHALRGCTALSIRSGLFGPAKDGKWSCCRELMQLVERECGGVHTACRLSTFLLCARGARRWEDLCLDRVQLTHQRVKGASERGEGRGKS